MRGWSFKRRLGKILYCRMQRDMKEGFMAFQCDFRVRGRGSLKEDFDEF